MKKMFLVIIFILIGAAIFFTIIYLNPDIASRVIHNEKFIPFSDAGQSCQNSDQCEGLCVIYDKNEKQNAYRLGGEYISQEEYNNAPLADIPDDPSSFAVEVAPDLDKLVASGRYNIQCSQFPLDPCDNWYRVEGNKVYYNSVLCN